MTSETDVSAEQFWESRYRGRARIWSGNVNAVLAEVAAALPVGAALDLGCGEGGDSLWLAGRGWQVTAVDVSSTALERAAAHAADAQVADRIDFQRHDLAVSFPEGRVFDLVSAQYLQSPIGLPRARVLQTAARSVKLGGLLLITDHASVAPWQRHFDPDARSPVPFPTPEQELAALELDPAQWRPERLQRSEREATGPDGQRATVADNVIVLRRVGEDVHLGETGGTGGTGGAPPAPAPAP